MKRLPLVLFLACVAFGASAGWSRHAWCEVKAKPDAGDGARTWPQVRETIRSAMLHFRRWPDDRGPLDLGGTLSPEEERTQILLWTAFRSPIRLVAGQKAKSPSTVALLDNARLKEIWSDPNLMQSWVVAEGDGGSVLLMDHGRIDSKVKIATFYNPCDRPVELTLNRDAAQLEGRVTAADALTGAPLEVSAADLKLSLPAHGARMVRLEGERAVMRRIYRGDAAIYHESGDDIVFRLVFAPRNGRYRLTVEPAGEGTYLVEVNGLTVREGCRGVSETEIPLRSGHNFIRLAPQCPEMPAVNFIRIDD